jgi:hypothetical protein
MPMGAQSSKQKVKIMEQKSSIPAHMAHLAPKREKFRTQEEYEEAKAFFLHRIKGAVRRHSSASPQK